MKLEWSTRFRYFVLGGVVIAFVALLFYARAVIPPLVVSALIAYVLHPVVDFLTERTRLHHSTVVAIVFFLGLAIILALPATFVPVLLTETQTLTADLEEILEQIQTYLAEPILILNWRISLVQFVPDFSDFLTQGFADLTLDALQLIETTTKNLLWVLVVLASTYYFLKDWEKLREWFISLAPAAYQPDARKIYAEIKHVWRGYLRGNLALMAVVAVLFTIAWLAIGVPGALILGIIAGLLTIIPDLGPAIAAVLAVLVGLVEGSTYLPLSNFWFAVLVLSVYLLLINIKNIWIRPRIFGRSVHMHDGIVFVAIIVAVVLQGILGALVIIPLLASAGIVLRYIWKRILGEEPYPILVSESEEPLENGEP